jgi:PTH1 family peptidyl-tRNA hydrolase
VARAVVGLGNPGPRYAATRHNAGFLLVEVLARRGGATLHPRGREARWAEVTIAGQQVVLVQPQTFMNRSGEPVLPIVRELGIEPANLLVAHDELDLPPAKIRLKRGGGTAGHRGLESLVEQLGTRDFPRLRIGIGRPPEGTEVVDYVLAPFADAERASLDAALDLAADGIEVWCRQDLGAAMAVLHAPRPAPGSPPGSPPDDPTPA